MALPAAVQRQNEEADRLMKEQKDASQTAVTGEDETGNTAVLPASTDLATPAVDPSIAPIQQQTARSIEGDFKHKFDVLSGKYNKEVREVSEMNRQNNVLIANQNSLIQQMQNRIADLESAKIVTPAQTPAELSASENLLKEEYPDIWEANQAMKTELQQKIQALEGRIEQVGGQAQSISQDTMASKKGKYLESLNTLVPTWRDVLHSEGFLSFADEIEPLSGASYRNLMVDAEGKLDAARIASIYKTFMSRTPLAQGQERKKDLAEFVVPFNEGGASKIPGQTDTENEVFTTSAVTNFYNKQALGKLGMNKDDAMKFEARILKARAENRIIQG